jgi:hypothetical protein
MVMICERVFDTRGHAGALEAGMAEVVNLLEYGVLNFPHTKFGPNTETIPVMLITTEKLDAQGRHVKFKARIVARGDKQRVDHNLVTNSPVVSFHTLLVSLNALVSSGEGFDILDVTSAYLEAEIDSEVNVVLSKKIVDMLLIQQGSGIKHLVDRDGTMVVGLNKALYGLRQSGRLWYDKLHVLLKEAGYSRSKSDRGLFTKRGPRGGGIAVFESSPRRGSTIRSPSQQVSRDESGDIPVTCECYVAERPTVPSPKIPKRRASRRGGV